MSGQSYKIKTAIIPAAGKGTRWAPITRAVPKEMLPIWRRPAIDYVVQEALQVAERVVIVISPEKTAIRKFFEDDPRVEFITQLEPTGLGGAILAAEKATDGAPFLVSLPDVVLEGSWGVQTMMPADNFSSCIMLRVTDTEDLSKYGVARLIGIDFAGCVEKPEPHEAPSKWAIVGRYVLGREIFEALRATPPDAAGEIQLTEAINETIGKVSWRWCSPSSRVFDVGTAAGMFEAWNFYSMRELSLEV